MNKENNKNCLNEVFIKVIRRVLPPVCSVLSVFAGWELECEDRPCRFQTTGEC